MLFNWLDAWRNKRKLSRFNSVESTWDYRLHNQNTLPIYNKDELTSKELDRHSIMSRCGTVQKLVESLNALYSAMWVHGSLPKIKNISRDKGEITLTNYLTTRDGYPYSIAIADRELNQILTKISEVMEILESEEEVKLGHYTRTIKPYITEAIDFRMLVNEVT